MKSNTRFKSNERGVECLNCHQPLSDKDNFCSNCGQVNDNKPLSIKQYLTEFLSGFFSFDTRTFNTILPLLFKPGKVTYEYVNGERMKYVNPFQLYLHTSIIFFLITGIFNTLDEYNDVAKRQNEDAVEEIKTETQIDEEGVKINFTNPKKEKKEEKEKERDTITKKRKPVLLNKELRQLITKKIDSIYVEKNIDSILRDASTTKEIKDREIKKILMFEYLKVYTKVRMDHSFENDSLKSSHNFKVQYINQFEEKLLAENIDYQTDPDLKLEDEDQFFKGVLGEKLFTKISVFKKTKTKDVGKALDSLGYERTRSNIFWFKKTKELQDITESKDARKEYFNDYTSKIAIVLFFLLPVFALFMSLLYIRRKTNYTEHLIFIFHLQTAFFILLLTALVIDRSFTTDVGKIIFFPVFAIYIFIAMRKFYKQGIIKTSVKFILLNLFSFFLSIFGIFFVGLLAFFS